MVEDCCANPSKIEPQLLAATSEHKTIFLRAFRLKECSKLLHGLTRTEIPSILEEIFFQDSAFASNILFRLSSDLREYVGPLLSKEFISVCQKRKLKWIRTDHPHDRFVFTGQWPEELSPAMRTCHKCRGNYHPLATIVCTAGKSYHEACETYPDDSHSNPSVVDNQTGTILKDEITYIKKLRDACSKGRLRIDLSADTEDKIRFLLLLDSKSRSRILSKLTLTQSYSLVGEIYSQAPGLAILIILESPPYTIEAFGAISSAFSENITLQDQIFESQARRAYEWMQGKKYIPDLYVYPGKWPKLMPLTMRTCQKCKKNYRSFETLTITDDSDGNTIEPRSCHVRCLGEDRYQSLYPYLKCDTHSFNARKAVVLTTDDDETIIDMKLLL